LVLFIESFLYVLSTNGASVIERIVPGMMNIKTGDIVAMQGNMYNSSTATFQQYSKTETQLITRVPLSISVEQAATIPVTITAVFVGIYHSTGLGLTPPCTIEGMGKYVGQSIFISGGSDGIGKFGIHPNNL
jgi:NADPH:quinone reductase-like Zn-dependent oxidoreductase